MPKDVFIAIAVAKPDALEPVEGAIPSARRLLAWAVAHGYDTELVSDELEPVTCERLRRVFAAKLGDGGQKRIIVSFAGHGAIRDGAEEYWLLNDWRTRATEAVNHVKLRNRLSTYVPGQLAVISDACRALVTEKAKWLEGNGIVDVKDNLVKPVQVASLWATRAAQRSFATPIGAEEAYCFFSHVLANALCGLYPDAVDEHATLGKVVLQDRLCDVVEREVPLLASRYRRRQLPELVAGWRSPDTVWSTLSQIGPADVPGFVAPPPPPLSFGFGSDPTEGDDREREAWLASSSVEAALEEEADRARHFEAGTGLIVTGSAVRDVVTGPAMTWQPAIDPGSRRWFNVLPRQASAPVLVCLDDGSWCGAALCAGHIGTFSVGPDGAYSFLLRSSRNSYRVTAWVAMAATGGMLNSYAMVGQSAIDLWQQNVEPVGVTLIAYAFARIGAVDEIRRLIGLYRGQPLSFDAALLARVPIGRDHEGYWADIPAMPARSPRYNPLAAATPATRVRVAGAFPWLRQGWTLLEDDRRVPMQRLAKLAGHLRPSLFTTLTKDAGDELAALLAKGEL